MNLGERLGLLEAHSEGLHEEINRAIFRFINYSEMAVLVDNKFKKIYRYWTEHPDDQSSKIGANFLLQTMAIMDTRFYRKLEKDKNRLAQELDIPDYSPKHLEYLIKNDDLVPNKLKRLRSRVRISLSQMQFMAKKNADYGIVVDYLEKLHHILRKE